MNNSQSLSDTLTDAIHRAALQVYRRHRDIMTAAISDDLDERRAAPLSDLEDFRRDIEDELIVALSEIIERPLG